MAVDIKMTEAVDFVPPAQKTWHGAFGSTSQDWLPSG